MRPVLHSRCALFTPLCLGVIAVAVAGCGKEEPPVRRGAPPASLTALGGKVVRKPEGTVIDLRNSPAFTDATVDLVLKETNVIDLTLQNVGLTDAGVAKLKSLNKLGRLILNRSRVTGASLAELAKMPLKDTLWNIGLTDIPVTDADLSNVSQFPRLSRIGLAGTKVTDAGLQHLLGGQFRMVDVQRTAVTEDGVAMLKKQFPEANILK